MGIRINENIFSLLVNRNLLRTSKDLEGSYERLSSGTRINSAADDPAGLANSHALTTKITGLQRNLMNANEGLNLLSVAESSLGGLTDMLQRLRELAIQASSDIMADDQRALIQQEVDQLLEEMDRIAVQANYNDRALLDGTFRDLRLQVGTRMDENIPISIESARTNVLGSLARATGAGAVDANAIVGNGDLTINGVTIPASEFDGVSTIDGTASAVAKAAAVNSVARLTGVTARVEPAVLQDPAASITGGTLDGAATKLVINGVNINDVAFNANDSTGALRDRINGFQDLTGVEASLGANGELVLAARDGRNFTVETTGGVADELGLRATNGDVNLVVRGSVTLSGPETIQAGGNLALLGLDPLQATTFVSSANALGTISMTTVDAAQNALDAVDVATQQVLERRAALGAIEGRLNLTIADLQLNIENLTGANSRIRDTDFALETTKMTQAQIIQQAGIAILSQANVIPRTALELLRT